MLTFGPSLAAAALLGLASCGVVPGAEGDVVSITSDGASENVLFVSPRRRRSPRW